MTELGTLPGYQNSSATSINALGEVVGNAGNPYGYVMNAAGFLYSDGVMTNLDRLISPSTG